MANQAQYTTSPNVGIAQLSVANTARDGTGTMGTGGFVAGGSGSRCDKAVIKATASTTAGMVRLFLTNGVITVLLTEIVVTQITVDAKTAAFEQVVDFLGGLVVPTGFQLKASTHNAETFNVIFFGGDF